MRNTPRSAMCNGPVLSNRFTFDADTERFYFCVVEENFSHTTAGKRHETDSAGWSVASRRTPHEYQMQCWVSFVWQAVVSKPTHAKSVAT